MGMIMQTTIQRARPEQHERLTQIAHAAKKHWGYPERWMEIWKNDLTITPEVIADNEVYTATVESEVAGFYGLIVSEANFSWSICGLTPITSAEASESNCSIM